MNTEIMKTIPSKLHRQLRRNDRDVLLLMDNASCHPQTLSGQFSNITVQFFSFLNIQSRFIETILRNFSLAYCPDLALLVTNFLTPPPLDVSKLENIIKTPSPAKAVFVTLIVSEEI